MIDKKTRVADGLFFVALEEDTVIGTVMAGYDGHRGWIYSLAVLPAYRKRGIGTALLEHAEKKLANLGCVKVNLQVMEGNETVVGFYHANGYSTENRISMGKRLAARTGGMPETDKTVKAFLDELSSSSPAPGGGSVAALSGALGAALISMVSQLTLRREKYTAVQDEMAGLLERSTRLRAELLAMLEEDVRVFMELTLRMKMPRDTAEQKAARAAAMDQALKAAAAVPMRVAEACVAVMDLCLPAVEMGNANAVSDAGVAALMAEAGLRGAALNVLINLAWIKDEAFVKASREKLDALLEGRSALRDEIFHDLIGKW